MFHGCANRGHWLSRVMRRYLAVALVLALAVPFFYNAGVAKAQGTTVTWTGAAGTSDWQTASNWDKGQVPADGDNVIIGTGKAVTCDIDTPSIILECAGDLTVSKDASLNLTGASTISGKLMNNGKIAVRGSGSDSLTLSGGGTGTGDFYVAGGKLLELEGAKTYIIDGNLIDGGNCAYLNVLGAGTVVTFNGSYDIVNSTVASGTKATWNGTSNSIGILNASGEAVFNRKAIIKHLVFSGGTIDGSGDIAIGPTPSGFDSSKWTSGTMSGNGTLEVVSGGKLAIQGPGTKNLNRSVVNKGEIYFLGTLPAIAGTIAFRNEGLVRTYADCTSDLTISSYNQTATGTLQIDIYSYTPKFTKLHTNVPILGGTLHLFFEGIPAAGTSYDLIKYTQKPSTQFSNLTSNLPAFDIQQVYGATELTVTVTKTGEVAAPTANPPAGTYTETQNVTLTTTTEGATIYYTTDGSNPTTASTQYTAPITVVESMTIKAIAVKAGIADSQVAEFIYVIEAADTEPPVVLTYTPANGATSVALNTTTLVLEFDEPVWGINNKALSIYEKRNDWKAADLFAQSSDNAAVMTGNGTTTISFNISSVSLGLGKEYYIKIAQGAFKDAAENEYAGIDDKTTWTFTVIDDTQAPTVPANLRCVSKTASSVELAWDDSIDDYGPIRYHIYVKNGTEYDFVGESATNSFTVAELTGPTPLTPNTTYTFVIRALDGGNNLSGYSDELSVTTLAVASDEAEITAYSFTEQTGPATINAAAGTIAVEVAHGTDVTNLKAAFTLSAEASAKVGDAPQVSGSTANDFTNPVTYVVTAEDGTTKAWTVTVTEAAAEAEFAGGNGTEGNPYLVATANQLNNVRNHLDKHFKQIADIDLDVEPYKTGNGWEPIGREANPFEGVYDGNGKAISNLFIAGTQPNVGLFGYIHDKIKGGPVPTVKNVSLVGVNVQGSRYVGGLAGTVYSGALESCSAAGAVFARAALGSGQVVGGLIGQCYSGAAVVNCHAAVNVNDQDSPLKGGLLGVSYGGTIESCSASGDVIGQANVGGLVGMAEANTTIIESYSMGNVVGLNADIGGLVGRAVKTGITKSYSTGKIQGGEQVGGLVGTLDNFSSITKSYSTGDAQGRSQSNRVGGLVGRVINGSTISKSYSRGNVEGTSDVGGLVGTIGGINCIVAECYSTGAVTGTGEAPNNLGGLVGAASIGTVAWSYWDTETSGMVVSAGGEGQTTTLMRDQATYINWDFTEVWDIASNKNGGYPFLRDATVEEPEPPSSEADITAFSLPQQTGNASIDSVAGTITIEVAHGTNVANLVATFTLSAEASTKVGGVDQVSGTTANNFTNPVTYTVTAEDGTTKDWTVTVTVKDPPPAADEPFWRYRSPLPTWRELTEVKYLNGKFMALGGAGTLIVSTDGANWESVCVDAIVTLRGITYGNGLYVAVGFCNGKDGRVYTSPDGINWSQAVETIGHQLYDITYGNNKFVAVGQGQIVVVSSDGTTWKVKEAPQNSYLSSIIYTGNLYVAVGSGSSSYSKIVVSTDGENWEARGSADCDLKDVAYGNGKLVAVGTDLTSKAKPRIYTSVDNGATWTPYYPAQGYEYTKLFTVEYDGNKFVAAGYSYSSDALYKAYVLTSTDGNVWTSISAQADIRFKALTVGNAILVGVGDYGDIVSSSDGVTWTKRTLGSNRVLDDIAYNGTRFVAVGLNGAIQTSDDGVTWTPRVSNTTARLGSVEYLNNKFIAVGGGGVILTSENGIDWTKQTVTNIDQLSDVTYGNNLYIIVGRGTSHNAIILTSSDGDTWSSLTDHNHNTVSSTITYGNGTFIALGYNQVYRSNDGRDWTGTYLSGMSPIDVIFVDGRFIATGEDGVVYISDNNGESWTVKEKVAGVTNQINSVAYGGGNLVAVTRYGKILISFDRGDTWTQQVSGYSPDLNGVVAGSSNFVAVGGSGLILQSKDFGTPSEPDDPDADAVAAAKAALTWESIKGGNIRQDNVTVNLVNPLPTAGASDTTISWSANLAGLVDPATGAVTRPTAAQGDKTVTLTATISKGSASDTKSFILIIKATAPEQTADDAIALDLAALTWNTIKGANSLQTNVTSKLVLPTSGANGTIISWSVDPTGLVNTGTGAVTRPSSSQGNKTVTLTATVSKAGGTSRTKDFVLTVIALPDSGSGGGSGGGGGGGGGKVEKIVEDVPVIEVPFKDVHEGNWFYNSVKYAYEKGLMQGTGPDAFSPFLNTSRAMIVTILHRLEKTPAGLGDIFTDVAAGTWYQDAVAWAAANGIIGGYGGNMFGPNDSITREQMACILYRYAKYAGYDVSQSGLLTVFTDDDMTSEWALEAMQWAVGSGLIQGKDGNILDPAGPATRAEAATILQRFIENNAK